MNTQYCLTLMSHLFSRSAFGRICVLLVLWSFGALLAHAQIVIGGDVYGGGLNGAVGSTEGNTETATTVEVAGQTGNVSVRTVFGGGKNGKVHGNTKVDINGGSIGDDALKGTPYGGVYGGGEGSDAVVSGSTNVTINGGENYNNVYGGGKQALLSGNAHVFLKSGIVRNNVFAGACMANINGYALVDIQGDNDQNANQLLIKAVYGGNDISGSILNSSQSSPSSSYISYFPLVTSGLSDDLSSYVFARSTATNAFIGNVFGGGNGAYQYGGSEGNWSVTMNDPEATTDEKTITFKGLTNLPVAPHAYLQIEGGTYGSIYGGGNKATISGSTDIYFGIGMNGESYADVAPMTDIPKDALEWLDLYEGYTLNDGGNTFKMNYNAFRIFGGNNIADMAIRPTWHLKSGMVGNIYSGGNQGRMTYEKGLFLPLTSNHIKVNNVYGGCRMADVNPGEANGNGTIAGENITYHRFKHADNDAKFAESYKATYNFAEGYAARVLVLAGQINNLYGGNDISGKVYHGTNVELRGAISGDVYGGGNGSYAYTDNADWKAAHPEDADYYYEPGVNSLQALYNKRPHVEKTLLHITGIDAAAPPVYVTGGVYCGGNSATLDGDQSKLTAKFMIGQNVIINGVFLGSNGENMVKEEILKKYKNNDFSSLELKSEDQFAEYMKGVSVNLIPKIEWEWDDNENTLQPGENGINSYIGSFYCGGNVGSMTTPHQMVMNFPRCLTVFDRIVGGCNASNISESDYNASLEGGVTNAFTNGSAKEDGKAKVVLNVDSRLEPRALTPEFNQYGFITGTPTFEINKENYTYDENVYSILKGANVYGGCYTSGYINGDVEININRDIVSPAIPEDDMKLTNSKFLADAGLTEAPFAHYVFSKAMNVFGGGYGAQTEIRGKSTINLDKNARVMKVFGGGEQGVVLNGATINLKPTLEKPANGDCNVYMVYGGGYEGAMGRQDEVKADIRVLLHGGRIYDAYGGSCNADIYGGTYVEVGDGGSGKLQVMNSVFGANDFGGRLHKSRLWDLGEGKSVSSLTHVKYLSGAVENEIYGGSFGSYDYTKFSEDEKEGFKFPEQSSDPEGTGEIKANTFVQVASQSANPADYVNGAIYGGGRGYANASGIVDVKQSYVHLAASPIRTTELVPTVFGGGYYSYVENTLVNAYSGKVGTIYGGTAGMSAEKLAAKISYNAGTTVVNLHSMVNPNMNVFGAGALAGAATTHVNLNGGQAANIYGGSFEEGICQTTNVNVLENSTVAVKSLYGGSKGKSASLPCDVETANIIVKSDQAYVSDTIFGGNHAYRAVEKTNIDIQVPVRMEPGGTLVNVYGGGNGSATITGSTHVKLSENAQLLDVYGGGKSGKVLDAYDGGALADRVKGYYASLSSLSSNSSLSSYPGNPIWDATAYEHNTHVELLGGELRNVYAGGYAGNVEGDTYLEIGKTMDAPTHAEGNPTIRRSAYGGGEMAKVTGTAKVDMFNGYVGYYYDDAAADKYVKELDLRKEGDNLLKENGNLYGAGYGEGAVVMTTKVNLYDGVIRNGLYGGGEIAAVGVGATKLENEKYVLDTSKEFKAGKANIYMYGGHVEGDVFGGGRGFSYDLTGNEVTGKIYYTDGYVFGGTNVEIYRGKIGTDASLEEGHGNVFGGGNIGYVYGGTGSSRSVLYTGETDAANVKFNGHYYTDNTWTKRTEDCHVHIEARCKVLEAVEIGGTRYEAGEYVPVEKLNTLNATAPEWEKLDQEGITIRNAVFAGGNVSSGSDKIYANAVTIYGNATASVVDVFAKDFISVGGDGVGGLYGDGNLTFVDGYRELNITNYGTDFYNLDADLTYDEYLKLSDREKGFYDLLYSPKENINFEFEGVNYTYHPQQGETAADEIDEHEFKTMLNAYIQDNASEMADLWDKTDDGVTVTYEPKQKIEFVLGGKTYIYSTGTSYSAAEYDEMMANYKLSKKQEMEAKWDINGECSLTAGRMLNTIQRADFCGMFGSRIMLYGAQDRVPEIVDYTKYTINRVGEVSLNQRKAAYDIKEIHGNYFGIYNVVNLLGALTSDVKFTDVREDVGILEEGLKADGTTKYIKYKYDKLAQDPRARNMASSKNMVAQASGVFLELVKEVDADGNKTYGPITGVIQLDLINVKPGEGGGYVYAENEHRAPTALPSNIIARQVLSEDNQGAVSYANFVYDGALQAMQTSGNFVHPTKRIVDECFPRGGYYPPGETNYSNAHFWYIRGDFYVYDQYVSGYTGAAQAYEQDIEIPLTIAAGSEGRMTLQSVNPSKYAYFVGKHYGDKVLTADDNILVEDKTYYLNDPISYWDWSQLSITDQAYFVDETYVAICDAKIDGTEYQKGHVLLPADYESLVTASGNVAFIKDINGNYQEDNDAYKETTKNVFRISNEISHDAGYLLTFDISNPLEWDNYYTQLNKGDGNIVKMLESEYKAKLEAGTINAQDYTIAPTLLCTKSGIYGQREYALDDLVNEAVYNSQNGIANPSNNQNIKDAYDAIKEDQAQFSPAYVVTADELSFTHNEKDYHMFGGSYISKDLYEKLNESLKNTSNFEPAYICINTIEVADKEYVLNGQLIPASRYTELKEQAKDNANTFMYGKADTNGELSRYFSLAYVCTKDGKYGGSYFEEKKNYRALDFCGLSRDERNAENVFTYNFDAFDLLATDFDPDIRKYQEPYWNTQAVNYTATYSGDDSYPLFMRKGASDTYDGSLEEVTINNGTTYQRAEYEQILNEKSHYMPIKVDDVNVAHYVVKETFEKANVYYPVGKVISAEEYSKLSELLKGKVTVFPANTFNSTGTYYYCTEGYIMSVKSEKITNCVGEKKAYSGKETLVPAGIVISKSDYDKLPNYQNGFIIQGHAPIQTTTIYVPRESDINNLSKDRVITVVYRYDYKEGEGTSITHHSEKHIINIHLEFRSGQPTIGDVTPPATVLPNSVVGLSVPSVKRGAYEILGGGWEIFETPEDAYEHKNGVEYKNNATPMYWYQNNYYVAYYAKTYLGKAYSNPVPFSVANYHRMGEVMHHPKRMFIDHKDVDRASKIYLDAADYEANSIAAGEKEKNDLDFLYDLYEETREGKAVYNQRITNAANLDFILRSDIAPKKYTDWQQPGNISNACFAGNFHGNGHTVSGLNKSLFRNLCGTVYNTGVTGSFTGGGVAEIGGTAVNCWVKTSGTPTSYAVIGNAAKDASDAQVINSYYDSANGFNAEGMATPRPEADFVKGHVAYDLNRYYLEARRGVENGNEDKKFMFFQRQPNGQLETAAGSDVPTLWTSYYHTDNVLDKYVEENIKTGDFIYANGEIPLEADVRMEKESGVHYPIYPDDYLFFGQSLNYTPSHDNVPEALIKNEDNLVVHNEQTANRVYRAPAYRKSSSLNQDNPAVYFNRHAAFAGTHDSKPVDADLTAIDFTGASGKETDKVKTAVVYTPLLDYEGLKSFDVTGITQNLLVYADAGDGILSASLPEPAYSANTNGWNEVDIVPAQEVANVKGHLVELVKKNDEKDGKYVSNRNHFLVDKQDFNAPLAYTFGGENFMWYQRTPEVFIDGTGGWEGLCLPFTAKMVSAHQKGEITHFYGHDNKAHEYWLRAPEKVETEDEKTHMIFACPKTGETGKYEVGNAFLYNYYYSKVDDNGDSYWNSEFNQSPNGNREQYNHGNYYAGSREYEDYAYLTANVPYIIGFPGVRYYEFDMSGQFAPEHSDPDISKLEKQTISYVSGAGANIPVSDDNPLQTTVDGYTYTGAFIGQDITNGYVLNNAGSAFDTATSVVPFRTYITKTPSAQPAPKRIHIGYQQEGASPEKDMLHNLYIRGGKGTIHLESTLEVETKVTIHTLSGVLVKELYVLPGAKVNVPVQHQGVYIVNRRKVSVN